MRNGLICNFWEGMTDSFKSCSAHPSTSFPSICKKLYNKGPWTLSCKSCWCLYPKTSLILGWKITSVNNNFVKKQLGLHVCSLVWVENYKDGPTDFLSIKVIYFLSPPCFHAGFGIPKDSVSNCSRKTAFLPLIPEAQQQCFEHLEGKSRCCHFSSAQFNCFRVINN